MKFVRISAVVTLALAAAACGGGADATVDGADGVAANSFIPSKQTNGATINVPGDQGATQNGASSETSSGAGGTNDGTANDGASASNEGAAPAAPADPAAPAPAAPAPAAPAAPTKPLYVPPECDADCVAHDIPGVIARASKKYNIPRWFYFAIVRRESTFNRCKTQPENAPNQDWGRGLTQVTFPWYAGFPFPQGLSSADNTNTDWRNNMGLSSSYGAWIDMKDVTPMSSPGGDCKNNPKSDDAYDPKTNIDRFSTGFAAPAYHLFHVAGESPEATLRKVAYHWHYGMWGSWTGDYPSDPRPYLSGSTGYDAYVGEYKASVEADDGKWVGPTCKPPYNDSGC